MGARALVLLSAGFSLSSRLFLKLTSMKDVSPWLIIQFPMVLSALSSQSLGGSFPASSALLFYIRPSRPDHAHLRR